MRIALCGPVTLSSLAGHLQQPLNSQGYPQPGLAELALQFVQGGHDVVVISTAQDISTPAYALGNGLEVVVVPSRGRAHDRARDLWRVERHGIAQAIRDANPEIVHAHWNYEFAAAALTVKSVPTLVTIHDAPLTMLRHSPDLYRLARYFLSLRVRFKSQWMTAVSPYVRNKYQRGMCEWRPIEVIPNPSPQLVAARKEANKRHGLIVSLGDSSKRKNIPALIKAFSLVKERLPGVQLHLAGWGLEPHGSLANWARSQGLAANVQFLGRLSRNQVSDLLDEASLLCHPSLEESHGLVLVEAMLKGVPIVAGQNSGAVPWTLFDGAAGLLVDVRRPTEIATALVQCLQDPDLGRPAGQFVYNLVVSRHHVKSVAAQYLEKYTQILETTP